MRRLFALAIGLCLAPTGAMAQEPAAETGDEAVESLGPESDALERIRRWEEDIFGRGQALAEAPDPPARLRITPGPSALSSSDSQPSRREPAGGARDLSWLRGLALPDIPIRWDARVIRYLELFRDDPRGQGFIRAWMRRLDRYGPMIRQTLSEERLPSGLIFVAMVESGFDPTARSHAGAAGMWQFVPRTGEAFGLGIDHWADLRLDPERATRAAGTYLRQLHDRFGTWELAFAAYNMGYGALLRSIRKYNTNDFWELSHLEAALPYETSLYVAKIIACAIVAHNPERFGLADLAREPSIEWETVEVPGGLPLPQLARLAGTDAATLRRLNPALRRGRTPPGRAWSLHVPAGSGERLTERLARQRPRMGAVVERSVRFGEALADFARSHGASVSEVRELNQIEEGERVAAGTTLLVPAGRRARAPERTEPAVVAVPPGPTEVAGRRRVFYRVASHDTVDEIAAFFRVGRDELASWNQLDPAARLQPGMFLQLFVPARVDLSRALVLSPDEVTVLVVGSEAFFAHHEAQADRIRIRYRIQPGDTLSQIGQRFGLSVASLSRINQIPREGSIRAGDEIIIYADPARVPLELRPDALERDALEPGGAATVERSGPEIRDRELHGEEPDPDEGEAGDAPAGETR